MKKKQDLANAQPVREYDVLGMGNLLMDLLIETPDAVLQELRLNKGEFHLADALRTKEVLTRLEQQNFSREEVPGGSSANTIRGVAFLGGKAVLCGKLGNDALGRKYQQALLALGVIPCMSFTTENATGHALTFITPDAQRTFSVHLGAAEHFFTEDLLQKEIEKEIIKAKVLHLEGYLFEGRTQEAALHAVALAKKSTTPVSLDLADPGVVRRNRTLFLQLVKENTAIVFANEEEAKAFTGYSDRGEASRVLGEYAPMAVVKYGVQGSLLLQRGKEIFIPSFPVQAVDTTGAGDCYAAGFLYGWCHGWKAEKAALLGSLFAAKIVQKKGVRIDQLSREGVFKELEEVWKKE